MSGLERGFHVSSWHNELLVAGERLPAEAG